MANQLWRTRRALTRGVKACVKDTGVRKQLLKFETFYEMFRNPVGDSFPLSYHAVTKVSHYRDHSQVQSAL